MSRGWKKRENEEQDRIHSVIQGGMARAISSNTVGCPSSGERGLWVGYRARQCTRSWEEKEGSKYTSEENDLCELNLLVLVGRVTFLLALVDLLVSAQVGNHGEVSPATVHVTCEGCLYVSTGFLDSRGIANSRFSPVWLYICVCREEGRVKRLSHTLHLCFFCVLEGIFELNWLIID